MMAMAAQHFFLPCIVFFGPHDHIHCLEFCSEHSLDCAEFILHLYRGIKFYNYVDFLRAAFYVTHCPAFDSDSYIVLHLPMMN